MLHALMCVFVHYNEYWCMRGALCKHGTVSTSTLFIVAENVIGKKSVSYKENILEISRKLKYKADEIAFTKDDITVVEVRGIGGLSGEDLQLVFENRRISGGGEILKLDMDSINNCAYIQFKDTNGMCEIISMR